MSQWSNLVQSSEHGSDLDVLLSGALSMWGMQLRLAQEHPGYADLYRDLDLVHGLELVKELVSQFATNKMSRKVSKVSAETIATILKVLSFTKIRSGQTSR